ncbi:MAG TPA: hypothetical protein VHO26_02770 [Propionibacteriaceae bacterium]|nr:hypothetical protein [Propionibacteriaceae bacterium]
MNPITRFLKDFGHFWVEFLIGDDWKLFALVVSVLVVGGVLLGAGAGDTTVVLTCAVLTLAGFCAELVLDLRLQARKTD